MIYGLSVVNGGINAIKNFRKMSLKSYLSLVFLSDSIYNDIVGNVASKKQFLKKNEG